MSNKPLQVFIGYDQRETSAYLVARESIRWFDRLITVSSVRLDLLQECGLYTRPTMRRLGKLWDELSGAYMSTEFANSRFLVPELVKIRTGNTGRGWALFVDCDVMVRANLVELRNQLDDTKAVMCVKHDHRPANSEKMDSQEQVAYPRKNWSSVMAFNCDHPSNDGLTVEMINSVPGRDLHRFCWLKDDEIGALSPDWNVLVGHMVVADPKIVHWTDGGPWLYPFRNAPYAKEWNEVLNRVIA